MSYSTNEELLDFIDCEKLELVIYKNKLKNKDVNIIINSSTYFYSVGVFLDNRENNIIIYLTILMMITEIICNLFMIKKIFIRIIVDSDVKYKRIY